MGGEGNKGGPGGPSFPFFDSPLVQQQGSADIRIYDYLSTIYYLSDLLIYLPI
jgi:hypothetical protein